MAENLRIGIPSKGRLSEISTDLLSAAGLSFRRQERSLFARVRDMPIDITFLRTDDIPVLCAEGAIDLGITGSDLVAEAGVQVATRLALGMGRCKLALCVPEDSPATAPAHLHGKRVATSFPNVTRKYLAELQAGAHLVNIGGSVVLVRARIPTNQFVVDGRTLEYHDGMRGTAEVRVRSERAVLALIPGLRRL